MIKSSWRAGISDSRPFAKNAKERGTHRIANARKIKCLGHPPVSSLVRSITSLRRSQKG